MAVETGDKVTRKYANFRGVDFRGEDCSLNRSPDALNVWRNYKKLASIETRPGLKCVRHFDGGVRDIRKDNNAWHVIDGDGYMHSVLEYPDRDHETEEEYLGDNGFFFDFGGDVYALGSKLYCGFLKFGDIAGEGVSEYRPFIPTTTIKKTPSGGGETYQDVNMLSPFRINTFSGDGESNVLHLDAQNIDKDFFPLITIGGTISSSMYVDRPNEPLICYRNPEEADTYIDNRKGALAFGLDRNGKPIGHATSPMHITGDILNNNKDADLIVVDFQKGTIEIKWAEDSERKFLPKPLTDGQDNITVVYKKKTDDAKKILGCTIAQEFDNRVFLSGNPQYPSRVWYSALNDPAYFSDLDYYDDGNDSSQIRSLVSGNNSLWVFRDTEKNNSVFYHVPTIDVEYGKIYPSSHSSISIGCVGRAINFNDDIVFFSRRGMESVSTDITTEQFATHKSSLVDRKMITHPKYNDMVLAEWEGYLLVFVGNVVFLADSRAVLTNEGNAEYEWYYWKLFNDDVTVTCATTEKGVLYIGTNRYVYSLTMNPEGEGEYGDEYYGHSSDGWGDKNTIESYWTTPKDKFGAPNKLKTTNKKGCVVEATGDVDVYAKVEDTDFEHIGTNNGVEDYFTSRIKRKKFKDIQLKFQSQTSFCLESATLEAFIGGYIKR